MNRGLQLWKYYRIPKENTKADSHACTTSWQMGRQLTSFRLCTTLVGSADIPFRLCTTNSILLHTIEHMLLFIIMVHGTYMPFGFSPFHIAKIIKLVLLATKDSPAMKILSRSSLSRKYHQLTIYLSNSLQFTNQSNLSTLPYRPSMHVWSARNGT